MAAPMSATAASASPEIVPLHEATFVVLDLETTGSAPDHARITEVGAVKFRGGERLDTLATLVDPGVAIPPLISRLTGITDAMVAGAPPIESVLPWVVEFVDNATVVGHNVGFDRAFLQAALGRAGRGPLPDPFIDTLPLARALLVDEVPNNRLGTLAHYLRTPNTPCHRALEDALATADVFHALLERLGTFGVLDLEALARFGPGRPQSAAGRSQV